MAIDVREYKRLHLQHVMSGGNADVLAVEMQEDGNYSFVLTEYRGEKKIKSKHLVNSIQANSHLKYYLRQGLKVVNGWKLAR